MLNPGQCDDFDFGKRPRSDYLAKYDPIPIRSKERLEAEHVLEAQLVDIFFANLTKELGAIFPDPTDMPGPGQKNNKVDLCTYIKTYWDNKAGNPLPDINGSGQPKEAAKWLADQYPTTKNWPEEFLLLPGTINQLKEKVRP